jgi:hypothetical protein
MSSNDKNQATTFQTTGLQRSSFKHDWFNFSLVIINFFSYAVVLFFNFASSRPELGIFPRTISGVSREIDTEYTPAGWTFSTWVNNLQINRKRQFLKILILLK